MKTNERLGIDCLSVFGLPPAQFVELAAKLGCGFITLGLPVIANPENYPAYSWRDPRTKREVRAALRDHGIALKVGEGCLFMPHASAQQFAAHLDDMAELGAQTINMVSINGDMQRSLDEFAALAEMSAARSMNSSIEFVAGHVIGNVAQAEQAVRHVGRSDCKLIIDVLHHTRAGGSVTDLAKLDPSLIGYIQLCDGRREATNLFHESVYERMCPGAGEFPLLDYLTALPQGLPVGLEVPQLSLAKAGLGAMQRLELCVDAARGLLAVEAARGLSAKLELVDVQTITA